MRHVFAVFLIGSLCCGCGDDTPEPEDAPRDARAADAAHAADGGPPAELVMLLEEAITAYDGQVRAVCPCLVAAGAYPSEEECLAPYLSGPTWAECGATILAEHDSAEARAGVDCYREEWAMRAACLTDAACEPAAIEACNADIGQMACAGSNGDLLQMVLERCPDLGLLSR